MRFKVDENLPVEVAEVLRQSGHDAVTVLEQQHGGSADARLAALCQQEGRVLVTLDMDFTDIRTYPPAAFPGLMSFPTQVWNRMPFHCNRGKRVLGLAL